MTESVEVGIVEDHPVFRQGLAGVVEDNPGLVLAFAVRAVPELDAELAHRARQPDVLLLDLELSSGGPQFADAVAHVRRTGMPVLVISAHGDRATVVPAIAAGAAGYLSKNAEPDEIIRAIRTVAAGARYISPTLAGFLLDEARSIKLAPRQVEILRLVARGDTNREIAKKLHISVNTVGSHLDRIGDTTGHRRRVPLVLWAIKRGLLRPSDPPE